MTKEKFTLTKDMISIEKEPIKIEISNTKERISLNIDSSLKRKLTFYCAENNEKMTSVIEKSIKTFLDSKK